MSTSRGAYPRHLWLSLAAAVQRRMDELDIDQADLAREAGLSAQVIRDLQRGVPKQYRAATMSRIAGALGWPPDAIPRFLSGQSQMDVAALEDRIRELESIIAGLRRQLDEGRSNT